VCQGNIEGQVTNFAIMEIMKDNNSIIRKNSLGTQTEKIGLSYEKLRLFFLLKLSVERNISEKVY